MDGGVDMLKEAEEYIGKYMDWKEIESLFPNCYVALDDYYNDGHITRGTLKYVCKNRNEMTSELKRCLERGIKLHSIYTTESKELNGLWQL